MVPDKTVRDHHEHYKAHGNGRNIKGLAIFVQYNDKIDMDSKQDSASDDLEKYDDNCVNVS